MDVLTDEHRMLQDSLNGILAETENPADIWPQLAGMGMLGLTLPESAGGADLGMPELLLFAHALGRACAATPFLATEILSLPLLAGMQSHAVVHPLLGSLADGSRIATLALEDSVPVIAERDPDSGFRLSGVKTLVPAGADADIAVLSVFLDGAPALFLLNLEAKGVTRTPYFPAAPGGGADIELADVALPQDALLAQGDVAATMVADARARGQLATCADMLGGMEVLLTLTLDYLRDRQQFGRSLAAFQVLQHAAVDMYVELETARAMLDYGTRTFGAPARERAVVLDAVKLKMNNAAKTIGENAVQLHGGIGMTEESLTGRLFARLTANRLSFGDSRGCMNRLLAKDATIALR